MMNNQNLMAKIIAIIKKWVLVSSIFFLMFDSGGKLGLQALAFLLLMFLAVFNYHKTKLYKKEMLAWSLLVFLLIPSIWMAALLNVEFSKMMVFIGVLLIFPIIHFLVRANGIGEYHFEVAGLIFASIIILLFVGRVFQIQSLVSISDYFSLKSAGLFNEKAAYSTKALPVVYFQGTPALLICGVFAVVKRHFVSFWIIATSLLVAPSRMGFACLLSVGVFVFFMEKSRFSIFLWLFLAVILAIFAYINLPTEFIDFIFSESSGMAIRKMHVDAIQLLFTEHPSYLFFGNGPGSEFYTEGFKGMTSNIEISQLELIRKYGIFWFTIFFSLYSTVTAKLMKYKEPTLYLALIAHFIFAASNPVLLSFPAVILFSISVNRIRTKGAS
jgi:hypothetical protein